MDFVVFVGFEPIFLGIGLRRNTGMYEKKERKTYNFVGHGRVFPLIGSKRKQNITKAYGSKATMDRPFFSNKEKTKCGC